MSDPFSPPGGRPPQPRGQGRPAQRGNAGGRAAARRAGADRSRSVAPPRRPGQQAGAFPPGQHPGPGRQAPQGRPTGPGRRPVQTRGAAAKGTKKRLIDYPRAGKTGFRRFIPSWRLIFGTFVAFTCLIIGAVVTTYYLTDLPKEDKNAVTEASIVYAADGTTELFRRSVENRIRIQSDQIPKHVKDAFVAAEDRSFYENRGVDPKGIARAVWVQIRGGKIQGGSTITQQYVKNTTRKDQKSLGRKATEAFQALRVDDEMTKDEIMTGYLNTAYFGRGAYSIETASQAFFGKSASQLTAPEAAVMAGIMPNPTNWDPRKNAAKAEGRWKYVMDGMVEGGFLSKADRDAAVMPQTLASSSKGGASLKGPNGYFQQQIMNELGDLKDPDTQQPLDLDRGGLRVTTTFDPAMQQAAVDVMEDRDLFDRKISGAQRVVPTLVAVDPATGAVKAMYGGSDFAADQTMRPVVPDAQAGSTFKAFGLIAALKEGYSLDSTFMAEANAKMDDGKFVRDHVRGEGLKDLREATAQSYNSVFARLNKAVGPAKAMDAAMDAGIPKQSIAGIGLDKPFDDAANRKYTERRGSYRNVLGDTETSSWYLAGAYATIASGGIYREPFVVAKVDGTQRNSADLRSIFVKNTQGKRVFSEEIAADATAALQGVTKNGTGTRASRDRVGRPIAGKTGTVTSNNAAWFSGFAPQLSTTVGLFATDESNSKVRLVSRDEGEIEGGKVPTLLFAAFMKKALEGVEVKEFPEEAHVGTAKGSGAIKTPKETDNATSTPTVSATTRNPFPNFTGFPTHDPGDPQNPGMPTMTKPAKPKPPGGNPGNPGDPGNPGFPGGPGGPGLPGPPPAPEP